jgi:pimeloyl-ACP methyl ester carboxylesterase
MGYITANGAPLFFTDSGGRAPHPALVCVHGAGGTHLHWPPHLRALRELRVLTLDLPGHGLSAGVGRTTVDAYADVVAALVEALHLDAVTLVGHSMGGAIGQILALRRVDWLAGLVLVGTSARLRVADAIRTGLQTDFPATTTQLARWLWGPTATPVQRALSAFAMRQQGANVVHGDFLACHHFDVRERIREIRLPTLVVGASHDQMTPFKQSERLAAGIPGAQLVCIPRAGHMMALEQPLHTIAAIQQFGARL